MSAMSNDEGLLASLGYKQELKRQFSLLQMFGLGFGMIGVVSTMSTVLVYSIPNGGTSAMVWGWALCSVFLTCIGLALSELASLAPTSGGLYYWTFALSSEKWRCFLCWTVGYSNTISNVASIASVNWGCAVQIMAAVSIGSDSTFAPTVGQTYGVFCALVVFNSLVNSIDPKIIARLQASFIAMNILVFIALIIVFPVSTPRTSMNTAKFALGDFTNSSLVSGWPDGFAFILSFLAPLWSLGCFDAPVHMSEEATNASIAVPVTIMSMTLSALVCGWALNVVMAFCMGTDYTAILSSPIGQPMATILFNSLGKNGTLAIWSFVIVIQFMVCANSMTPCSRQIFAFSRDGGLPFSRWIYFVNPGTGTPTHAVWTCGALVLLLGAIAFAGPSAIGAVFSLVVTSQYVSYMIPITARFVVKREKETKPGPFSLGILSLPVAAVAVVWMFFTTVVFMFPLTSAPTVGNMNYTVVVQGGVLVLATIYFYLPRYGGRHWFKGPVSTLEDSVEELLEGENKEI
ncbi:amino acid transporter [Hymenopellis radicata]|nr:amino acid transporter [Hymenopellis radicata]